MVPKKYTDEDKAKLASRFELDSVRLRDGSPPFAQYFYTDVWNDELRFSNLTSENKNEIETILNKPTSLEAIDLIELAQELNNE